MDIKQTDKGVVLIEIEESKIIGNLDKIIRMLGMIYRVDKEAPIFSDKEERTQETLPNLVKNNVYMINDNLNDDTTFNTCIYSDSS